MKRVMINPLKCKNCIICKVEIDCPKKAILREEKNDKPWIDFYKCSGCLKCKIFCTEKAIEELTRPCSESNKAGW
jgi:Pyruvate/2-oxoacid:ferredoxin oxidoreductase delta subunit